MRSLHLHRRLLQTVVIYLLAGHFLGSVLSQDEAAPMDGENQPAAPPALPPPRDAFVKELLAEQPKAPADFVRTISILIDVRHAPYAAPLLKKLSEQMLDDAALAALVKQFGEETIFKIGLNEELQPQAGAFMQSALTAAAALARDPQRLTMLIDQLKDPSAKVRREAVSGLADGGTPGIEALLAALADSGRSDEHANIRSALIALRGSSLEPLLGALVTQDPEFKAQIVEVLGRIGSRSALKFLVGQAVSTTNDQQVRATAEAAVRRILGSAPTTEDAVAFLKDQTRQFLAGTPPQEPDFQGNVTVYRWDDNERKLIAAPLPAQTAALVTAARIAADLYALAPQNLEARRLYLSSLLQAAAYFNGLDQPLPPDNPAGAGAATAVGVEGLTDFLSYALEQDQPVAAAAAARLLGQIGSADLVQSGANEDSLLVRAARDANRRTRFAGVEAIVQLKPNEPFRGRDEFERSLAYLASYGGVPKVLIGDSKLQDGRTLAGLLNELGYEADVVATAREFIQKAAASPDYVLGLLDARLPGEESPDIIIQKLQQDDRSAALPLGLIVPVEVVDSGRRAYPEIAGVGEPRTHTPLDEMRRIAAQYDHVQALVRPNSVNNMELQVAELMAKAGPHFVAHEERLRQATQALDWIAALGAEGESLYEFQRFDRSLEAPLFDPELSSHAAAALAQIGSSAAQQGLATLGDVATFPDAARQAASDALKASIARFGVLLAQTDSQTVLASVVLRPAILDNLAKSPEHDAQAYLANLASDARRPLDLRQAAAAAFVAGVNEHGVLLDSAEVYRQYERYNASEMKDQETQALLSSMLDAIEAAAAKAEATPTP